MPRRPCIVHGCPEYVDGQRSRCSTHHAENERGRWDRGLTGRRGTRPGWRKLRAQVIREQHGWCFGHPLSHHKAPATDVHHINGDATDDRRENLIGLCHPCHLEADAAIRAARRAR